MKSDGDVLVSGWVIHAIRGTDDEEYSWAWEAFDDLVRAAPEQAWPLVLKLVEQATTDLVLAVVAAGPLENLLCEHGPAFIDRAVEAAYIDYRFRRCLRGVWGWSRMSEEIRSRIDNAVKDIPVW